MSFVRQHITSSFFLTSSMIVKMQLFKENEKVQNNAVHIISFPVLEILKIKELYSLHNELFAKDCFEKKSRSSFMCVLLKNQTSNSTFAEEETLKALPEDLVNQLSN